MPKRIALRVRTKRLIRRGSRSMSPACSAMSNFRVDGHSVPYSVATSLVFTDEQLKSSPGPILHFPTVLGAVVPVYNVAGVTQPLHFTGGVLASEAMRLFDK